MNRHLLTDVTFKAIGLLILYTALSDALAMGESLITGDWEWHQILLMAGSVAIRGAFGGLLLWKSRTMADRLVAPDSTEGDSAYAMALAMFAIGSWAVVSRGAILIWGLATLDFANIQFPQRRLIVVTMLQVLVGLALVLGRRGLARVWSPSRAGSGVSAGPWPPSGRTLITFVCGVLGVWFVFDAVTDVAWWVAGGGRSWAAFGIPNVPVNPDGWGRVDWPSLVAALFQTAAGLILLARGSRIADWWIHLQRPAGARDLEPATDSPSS